MQLDNGLMTINTGLMMVDITQAWLHSATQHPQGGTLLLVFTMFARAAILQPCRCPNLTTPSRNEKGWTLRCLGQSRTLGGQFPIAGFTSRSKWWQPCGTGHASSTNYLQVPTAKTSCTSNNISLQCVTSTQMNRARLTEITLLKPTQNHA